MRPESLLTTRVDPHAPIAIVTIDMIDRRLNVLTSRLLDELEATIDVLEHDSAIEGIVVTGERSRGFLAGADIRALLRIDFAEQYTEVSRRAQAVFGQLEGLDKPVVAAIHGPCLGAGLELALACHARIASDDRRTRVGQPEARLGLIPGAGGTVRLPRLIGLRPALDLMLAGREVVPHDAKALGLLDDVVPAGVLEQVAVRHAQRLRRTEVRRSARHRLLPFIETSAVPRKVILEFARRQARATMLVDDPAPRRLLDVVEVGIRDGVEAGLQAEAEAFGNLAAGATARELMGLFVLRQSLARDAAVEAEPRVVHRVGIVGAGFMGRQIAYVTAAKAGLGVRIRDRDHASVRDALLTVDGWFDAGVRKHALDPIDATRHRHAITATTEDGGLARCQLVLEAVPEDLDLKRSILRVVEEHGSEHLVFASSTAAIPIRDITKHARRPHNVVGMHYFSPVLAMPLVEIVSPALADPEAVATCVALAKRQRKLPIVVGDGPGFYTTRILAAYLAEAARMLCEGIAGDRIDRALVRLGFPLGPFALLDHVGLREAAAVERVLGEALWTDTDHPHLASVLVGEGREGKRAGLGFYRYDGGEPKFDDEVYELLEIDRNALRPSPYEIAWRCVLQLVNEAARCLDEGILHSPRDGDAGAVLGLGFPAYLGGPFRLVMRRGTQWMSDQMLRRRDEHGDRFEPSRLLREGELPASMPLPGE